MTKVFTAFGNPAGLSGMPWFELRDNELFPSFGHPNGISPAPWFLIKKDKVYPAFGHPNWNLTSTPP